MGLAGRKNRILVARNGGTRYICIVIITNLQSFKMSATAIEILQQHGISPSLQRIAIMDYLIRNRMHPMADEVYTALVRKIPTLSKTTVYNTLHLFVEHGVVQMLTIDEKKVCYDGVMEPHAHFMCRCCGRLIDVELPVAPERLIPKADGFRIDESHLYYKGVCRECLASESEGGNNGNK